MAALWLGRSALAALALAGAADRALAADPQSYDVQITGEPAGVDATLRASSGLVSLAKTVPVPPFAVITRAREDVGRIQTVLDSFGYYANKVVITVAGLEPGDPALPAKLDAIPAGTAAPVVIAVTAGPLYHIGHLTLEGAVPQRGRDALKLATGDPAVAAAILDAGLRVQAALQEGGYALAKVDGPDATADDADHTIDLVYTVHAGPPARIGAITFKGLKDVNESFARESLTINPGDRYSPSRIEAARQALAGLGVFSGVSVDQAQKLSPDGSMPLTFDVEERKEHAVTFTGTYSTDLGISLGATWSHRNLFGNAEQLNLTAAGTGLGTASAGLGYNLIAQYIQPFFLERDQALEFDISGVKQQLDAYDQTAETIAGFVRRKFSPQWSGSAGLSLTHDLIAQEGTSHLYELLAAPVTVAYDSTGISDPLHDPVAGLRASLALTPTDAIGDGGQFFLVAQAAASTYFDLSKDGSSVVALRALVGSILGSDNLGLPPDQRLYAGGSATVRGYAYQSIGPQFADGNPVGAKSVDAATVEFRQRVLDDWGAAVFVDAGQTSEDTPFSGALRVGAGVGARYYTPIGAVRLDVAMPLNRVHGSDAFEIYIGLGQAF